jgi:hypothetical protein
MRVHFDALARQLFEHPEPGGTKEIESRIFLSLWYAGLSVVIEGWKRLKLTDAAVDELLKSKNVKLLKDFRDSIYHFQPRYDEKRFVAFITEGTDVVPWVRTLNVEMGRWFLDYFKQLKLPAPPTIDEP